MARTESAMLALGTPAPAFSLKDVRDNTIHTTASLTGSKGLLVMFICCHCPFVKHIEQQLAQLALDFRNSGVGIAAISSNDAENYLDDAPSSLAQQALKLGFIFPYLYDATPPAPPTSFSSTPPERSCTAASSTPAARGTTFPSPAATSAPPSKPSSQGTPSARINTPA